MTRLVRIIGFLLILIGALVLASYLIEPLQQAWPQLWSAFRDFPIPIQIGLTIAAFGFVLLFGSVIWERLEDREHDHDLLND